MSSSKYGELLTALRFRESAVSNRSILLSAESDRGRLLFCPAFRRLQQKAQVFSLESNAAVRSRLTHSLEVSQTGRYIADEITIRLLENGLATQQECFAIATFVETACLMHDIGNPPFGHFGEAAIAQWFSQQGPAILKKLFCSNADGLIDEDKWHVLSPQLQSALFDFIEFDGNPQGLRVVAKLQKNSDIYGLNLTKTTLASYLKYIRESGEAASSQKPFMKKAGFFSTERDLIQSIWHDLGYSAPQRFPLAYIMEAADDIAYCISDLEDSIEKNLLNKNKAFGELHSEWTCEENNEENEYTLIADLFEWAQWEKKDGQPFTFTDFRTHLNRILVKRATESYIQNHEKILAGELESLIPESSAEGKVLKLLKKYCRENVYCHVSVQKTELAGYKAISGLLDNFKVLLECDAERFACALNYNTNKDCNGRKIIVENKLLVIFPKNYKEVYEEEVRLLDLSKDSDRIKEWNLRAHLITDFISGMTDDYSMKTYQSLSGIKV